VHSLSKYEKILILLFLLSLPFVNPWVRGDGVGYYAFARAPLIEHSLDFRNDWARANSSFRMSHFDSHGNITPEQFTKTGHLNNHFSVGPAILWAPFLLLAHVAVKMVDAFGGQIAANGFSRPYTVAMAAGTALYGFLALWISFRLARRFVSEEWAFLAALGVWLASSLPVYMYFNPSWSHAQSAFAVAVFIWYWLRTLSSRTTRQWLVLGAIGGLMMDVYYINAVLLFLPFAESIGTYRSAIARGDQSLIGSTLLRNLMLSLGLLAAFLPTLITKKIIYGSFFDFGYGVPWYWSSPAFVKVAFSSDHGFFIWTPVLIFAVLGLLLFARQDRKLAGYFVALFLLYLYAIGCYSDWDGLSSFGNRFFVSLTPIFVIGLAAFFQQLAKLMQPKSAVWAAGFATAVLIAVNFGLMFQWGIHLIPPRGPISLRAAARNEVVVVPEMAAEMVKSYFTRRSGMMNQIEQEDVKELKTQQTSNLP
jgi:hypothetical protein